jgi:hypothetical protein
MGTWGTYDNENDEIGDEWDDFIQFAYPNEDEDDDDTFRNDPNNFTKLLQFCNKRPKTMAKYPQLLPGLILYGLSMFDNRYLLPKDFPQELANKAIFYTQLEFDDEYIKEQGWANDQERKNSLNHQLYIFSDGEKGCVSDIKN